MDICGRLYKRHEANMGDIHADHPDRLSSNENDPSSASAATTPVGVGFSASSSSTRKFKFRPRFADEGLESFVSSDSEEDTSPPEKKLDFAGTPLDLSLARKGPTERITNKTPYDLCTAPPRE